MSPDWLAEHLASIDSVRFATLFGSRASGSARADSDWDVGLYFDESLPARERLETRRRIGADMPIDTRVDLVDLNQAPPLLAHRALSGERLVVKDQALFNDFFVRTMGLAEDQRYWDAIHHRARMKRLENGTFGRP